MISFIKKINTTALPAFDVAAYADGTVLFGRAWNGCSEVIIISDEEGVTVFYPYATTTMWYANDLGSRKENDQLAKTIWGYLVNGGNSKHLENVFPVLNYQS